MIDESLVKEDIKKKRKPRNRERFKQIVYRDVFQWKKGKRYRDLWSTEVQDQEIKGMIDRIMVSSDDEKSN